MRTTMLMFLIPKCFFTENFKCKSRKSNTPIYLSWRFNNHHSWSFLFHWYLHTSLPQTVLFGPNSRHYVIPSMYILVYISNRYGFSLFFKKHNHNIIITPKNLNNITIVIDNTHQCYQKLSQCLDFPGCLISKFLYGLFD